MATPHPVPCPPAHSHQSRPLRGTTVLGDTAIPAPCPTLAAAGRVSMGLSQARLVVMDEMEPGTQKSISLKTGNHEAAMCSLAGSREEKRGHTGGGWAGSAAAVPLGPGLSLHSSSQILRSCFCIKVQSQPGAGPRPAAPRGWATLPELGALESGLRVCPSALGAAQPTTGQCPPHSCPVAPGAGRTAHSGSCAECPSGREDARDKAEARFWCPDPLRYHSCHEVCACSLLRSPRPAPQSQAQQEAHRGPCPCPDKTA